MSNDVFAKYAVINECPVHGPQNVIHATCRYCRPACQKWWAWEKFPICGGRVTEYDPLPLAKLPDGVMN